MCARIFIIYIYIYIYIYENYFNRITENGRLCASTKYLDKKLKMVAFFFFFKSSLKDYIF